MNAFDITVILGASAGQATSPANAAELLAMQDKIAEHLTRWPRDELRRLVDWCYWATTNVGVLGPAVPVHASGAERIIRDAVLKLGMTVPLETDSTAALARGDGFPALAPPTASADGGVPSPGEELICTRGRGTVGVCGHTRSRHRPVAARGATGTATSHIGPCRDCACEDFVSDTAYPAVSSFPPGAARITRGALTQEMTEAQLAACEDPQRLRAEVRAVRSQLDDFLNALGRFELRYGSSCRGTAEYDALCALARLPRT